MDRFDEIKLNIKKKRMILLSKSSECLLPLQEEIASCDKKTVVVWALSFAKEAVDLLSLRYPREEAPREALILTKLWAQGKVKMPEAKRAILACHGLAKRLTSSEDIAICHAVGQALGTVHAKGHAIGFPIYELTSIVRKYGIDNCKEAFDKRLAEYTQRLQAFAASRKADEYEWAKFFTN